MLTHTSTKLPVSHFCAWNIVPEEAVEGIMADLAENGAEYISLIGRQLKNMLEQPGYSKELLAMVKKYGLQVIDAHGLCGPKYDLDIPDDERQPGLIEDHRRSIAFCAEFGVRTYTIHVGAAPYCRRPNPFDLDVLRQYARKTLEALLPTAEKHNIIIAVENSFEPPNAPDEIIGYINHFNSPFIQCCYDSGHANYMRGIGKELQHYKDTFLDIVWRGELKFEDNALEKLAPHIVTCHLHDNCGYSDDHNMPGSGTVDWVYTMKKLRQCPQLISIQNEANFAAYQIPIEEVCHVFNVLTKEEFAVKELNHTAQ